MTDPTLPLTVTTYSCPSCCGSSSSSSSGRRIYRCANCMELNPGVITDINGGCSVSSTANLSSFSITDSPTCNHYTWLGTGPTITIDISGSVPVLNASYSPCGTSTAVYNKSDGFNTDPVGTYTLHSQSNGSAIWPSTMTVFNGFALYGPASVPSIVTVSWSSSCTLYGPSSLTLPITSGPSFYGSGELSVVTWSTTFSNASSGVTNCTCKFLTGCGNVNLSFVPFAGGICGKDPSLIIPWGSSISIPIVNPVACGFSASCSTITFTVTT